jgi:hypothetical protein
VPKAKVPNPNVPNSKVPTWQIVDPVKVPTIVDPVKVPTSQIVDVIKSQITGLSFLVTIMSLGALWG